MTPIFNLTQHNPTPDQKAEGVLDTTEEIKGLLTFTSLPTKEDVVARAKALADVVERYHPFDPLGEGWFTDGRAFGEVRVMIGGAPYLMGPLTEVLRYRGFDPVFSFTERKTVEKHAEDGTVTKTAVFEHVGWVQA